MNFMAENIFTWSTSNIWMHSPHRERLDHVFAVIIFMLLSFLVYLAELVIYMEGTTLKTFFPPFWLFSISNHEGHCQPTLGFLFFFPNKKLWSKYTGRNYRCLLFCLKVWWWWALCGCELDKLLGPTEGEIEKEEAWKRQLGPE